MTAVASFVRSSRSQLASSCSISPVLAEPSALAELSDRVVHSCKRVQVFDKGSAAVRNYSTVRFISDA